MQATALNIKYTIWYLYCGDSVIGNGILLTLHFTRDSFVKNERKLNEPNEIGQFSVRFREQIKLGVLVC